MFPTTSVLPLIKVLFIDTWLRRDIRIGKWYTIKAKAGQITMEVIEDRLKRADPVVLAFDIETSKSPLKFPDATVDSIMMISYMIDGQVSPISTFLTSGIPHHQS
jgi:DNA polymerase elongation subunit (family B)